MVVKAEVERWQAIAGIPLSIPAPQLERHPNFDPIVIFPLHSSAGRLTSTIACEIIVT